VANPQQFAVRFGDIVKISFQWCIEKYISLQQFWVL